MANTDVSSHRKQWVEVLCRDQQERAAFVASDPLPSGVDSDNSGLQSNWINRTGWTQTLQGCQSIPHKATDDSAKSTRLGVHPTGIYITTKTLRFVLFSITS
jgi:hypothetical protein